jgi:23S rRNA G2445 N2-methylase RlmL
MVTGIQIRDELAPNQTRRWFTFNWSATQHVLWEVVPATIQPGAAQVSWNVAIERSDNEHVTYWITATNLTNTTIQIEGRYAIIS